MESGESAALKGHDLPATVDFFVRLSAPALLTDSGTANSEGGSGQPATNTPPSKVVSEILWRSVPVAESKTLSRDSMPTPLPVRMSGLPSRFTSLTATRTPPVKFPGKARKSVNGPTSSSPRQAVENMNCRHATFTSPDDDLGTIVARDIARSHKNTGANLRIESPEAHDAPGTTQHNDLRLWAGGTPHECRRRHHRPRRLLRR